MPKLNLTGGPGDDAGSETAVSGKPRSLSADLGDLALALGVGIMTHGGAAARLGSAAKARAMVRRGAGPVAVKRATGYERGPFGWGVETRGDAALRPAAVFGAVREGTLGDVADVHPDVAKAYPGIERLPVRLVPSAEWEAHVADARAMYASRGVSFEGPPVESTAFAVHGGMGPVSIRGPRPGERLDMFAERADASLVHELQHVAQERDGVRAPYGGPYAARRLDAREVEARNSANRRWLTPEERVEMPRSMTQDVRPEDVHLDDKGGEKENYHRDFTNFLATDEVPETLFGYPVVQDGRGYTESDLRFFRENPKAAGFYDTGDEGEAGEDTPQQAVKAGIPMLASIFGPAGLDNLRKANWKNPPELAKYKEHGHEIQIGELKDVRLRKGWKQALLRKEKKLSDLLDFSSPQGRRLTTAYPGIQNIPVTNDDRGAEADAHGGYFPPSMGEEIWLNPRSIGIKGGLPFGEQYDTILHEGINHAIYSREPSFQGPNVTTHDLPSSKFTPLGYAMSLNEVLASLASRRGAERDLTGRGAANSSQFAKEILPEAIRRVNDLTETQLVESQGKILAEDVVPAKAAEPEDMDLPLEEPVPDHLDAKGGDSANEEYAEAAKKKLQEGAVD